MRTGRSHERPLRARFERSPGGSARPGREAVAVCLLQSYLFPDHEREIGAILRDELPGVGVTLSSDILREQGEYERTATTAVNAYVQPLVAVYLDDIRRGLAARKIRAPVMIMQSSGGTMTAADARMRPSSRSSRGRRPASSPPWRSRAGSDGRT